MRLDAEDRTGPSLTGGAERLLSLVAELFQCPPSELDTETGPGDIPGWDSLGHVALMAEIHRRFGTHIPVEDAIEVESIGDLVVILERLGSEAQ